MPGRVITIFTSKYHYTLAVFLQYDSKKVSRPSILVLLLCSAEDENEEVAQGLIDATVLSRTKTCAFKHFDELYLLDSPISHAVVSIPGELIVNITEESIKVDHLHIISDYQRRQIPRFRYVMYCIIVLFCDVFIFSENQPSQSCIKAVQELCRYTENFRNGLNPIKDLKISDINYNEMLCKRLKCEAIVESCECVQCPQFLEHVSLALVLNCLNYV